MSEADMDIVEAGNDEEWAESTRIGLNVAAALFLFVIAVGGGATPKWLVSRQPGGEGERSLAFSLGNMLSSGGEDNERRDPLRP